MNILIPFKTHSVDALVTALARYTRDPFECIADLPQVFGGQLPDFLRTNEDLVLIDLDSSELINLPADLVLDSIRLTLEKLEELIGEYPGDLCQAKYRFVYFSTALADGYLSNNAEFSKAVKSIKDELPVSGKLLLPSTGFLPPPLRLWSFNEMAQALVTEAGLTPSPILVNQKETPTMPINLPRLTVDAHVKLNNLQPAIEGLRFSCGEQLVAYTYVNAPGELRQRVDLLTMSPAKFFAPGFTWPQDIFRHLESFVLLCSDKERHPGDAFEDAFAKFLEIAMRESPKAPEATAPTQALKPNTHSRWNSPECTSGLTNAMSTMPASLTAPADRPFTGARLSAPEDAATIREKYAALMTHIGHVKHWIGLFTQLSAEDSTAKDDIFKELALPHQLACTIDVVLRFSLKDLFTDQFLAAKQDGAYLGVGLSVAPQSELEFVSIHCSFKFD